MFSITPMNMKLRLEAGETYEGTLKLFTPSDLEGAFNYKVEVSPYNVVGSDYAADLTTQTNRSQIVDWITFPEPRGTLRANETKEIHFTVHVPENAAAGGQYAVIMVGSEERDSSAADGTNGMSIKNIYQMGSVIYAQVAGETKRGGAIEKNEIPGFVAAMPLQALAEMSNNGNIHETAKIDIKVKNVISGEQLYPEGSNDGSVDEMIMPETTRAVMREIKDLPAVGIYEVTQSIDYLGQHSDNTQVVVACPVWFILMIIAVIGIIITGIVLAVKQHRKKKVLL